MSIADNLARIRTEIAELATSSGRSPDEIRLIAVSKTHPPNFVKEALAAGQTVFGENRVQELTAKQPDVPQAQWHLIGHLQTNKVKYIAPFVAMIHSVDSEKLLEEIDKRAAQHERIIPVLIQVNISDEGQKSGVAPDAVAALLTVAGNFPHVAVQGLMGMAALTEDNALIRKQFRSLRLLRDDLSTQSLPPNVQLSELSMGMSGDYPIAIQEGATLLRIGSAIFGVR